MENQKAEKKVQKNEKNLEECVVCGELTNVPKDLDINSRPNYVEGVGQLCIKCDK